jgi:hypothetical protein
MKKISAFLFFSMASLLSASAHNIDSVYYTKHKVNLYDDCNTSHLLFQLPAGSKVVIKSTMCSENMLNLELVNVEFDSSKGWILLEALVDKNQHISDSINNIQYELASIEANRKKDSITKAKEALKFSKPFWIDNIHVIYYTDETAGISVDFYNTSPNTIKYINFTVIPYNAVDDPVIDNLGKSFISCQLIGPIRPSETAQYFNKILFFSGVVSYYKLKNISVQYMDNSIKYYNFKDVLKPQGAF